MIRRLSRCIREYKWAALLSPLCMVGEVAMEVLIPLVMADLYDYGIKLQNMQVVAAKSGILVLCALASLAFGVLSAAFASKAGTGFAKNLRHDMYHQVQDFSFSNIDKFSTAGIITRLTTDVTNVQNALNTRVKELGNFLEETAALNALRDPSISGNAEIVVAHLTYQKHMSITLIQNIENDYCRQIIFNHAKVFQRAIYFTGSDRKTISYAEDWGCLFPDRMAWDVNTNKYVLSQFGMKFNALYTDAIPLASSTTDGLMSKGDKKTLDATSTDLVNLYNMIMTLGERVDDLENKMKTVQTKLNA